jgi:DNA-binding phage protein
METGFSKYEIFDYLKSDEDMILFLEACFEEAGDDAAFMPQHLAKARLRRQRA